MMLQKRILIVNCYPGITRIPLKTSIRGPQPMAPAYLAGVFSAENCDIKLYDEVASGWLEDEALLGWPDMLVLTGLNPAFDRFLQLTAYARTKNPNVIVVAGGGAIKMLKHYVHHNSH